MEQMQNILFRHYKYSRPIILTIQSDFDKRPDQLAFRIEKITDFDHEMQSEFSFSR